jgi:pimeloyl-ACP methyl ester carboxylesterase
VAVFPELGLDHLDLSDAEGAVMKEAIETRELITLDGPGAPVRATYHRTREAIYGPQLGTGRASRLGVVFLNSLTLPRAATGDSAVYWADAFAQCGYPSFRIDLPGLGDTDGDLPIDLLNYINTGKYSSIASAKIKELVERFNLSGVVVVGHCAGAASALFTAYLTRECRGLILMDAYFHLPRAIRPKLRQRLSDWALHSRVGGLMSNIYDILRNIRLFLRGNSPPPNANFPLLRIWKELASAGLPILLFKAPSRKAPGTKPRVGEFDYIAHILGLAGRKSQVVIQLIEGTDHSFANRLGRAVVRRHAEQWLNQHFPLAEYDISAGLTLPSASSEEEIGYGKDAQSAFAARAVSR